MHQSHPSKAMLYSTYQTKRFIQQCHALIMQSITVIVQTNVLRYRSNRYTSNIPYINPVTYNVARYMSNHTTTLSSCYLQRFTYYVIAYLFVISCSFRSSRPARPSTSYVNQYQYIQATSGTSASNRQGERAHQQIHYYYPPVRSLGGRFGGAVTPCQTIPYHKKLPRELILLPELPDRHPRTALPQPGMQVNGRVEALGQSCNNIEINSTTHRDLLYLLGVDPSDIRYQCIQ